MDIKPNSISKLAYKMRTAQYYMMRQCSIPSIKKECSNIILELYYYKSCQESWQLLVELISFRMKIVSFYGLIICKLNEQWGLPFVEHGNNASFVNTNLFPSRLSHVEMGTRRVTPASIVTRKIVIWWAKICSCNCNRYSLLAPCGVCLIITDDLVALATGSSIIEQCSAQCCCPCSIPCWIQVSISTSTTYKITKSLVINQDSSQLQGPIN